LVPRFRAHKFLFQFFVSATHLPVQRY
jgi:hypothetical protein